MSAIVWTFAAFDELTPHQLYAMLQLRSEVFVVEQVCIFQDMDGRDADAMHLAGTDGQTGTLVAYARCLAPGAKYTEASIGRVIARQAARGTGLGHALMRQALACVARQWRQPAVRIGAQARLENFYRQHGFSRVGEVYDEDGIAHVDMLRPAVPVSEQELSLRA